MIRIDIDSKKKEIRFDFNNNDEDLMTDIDISSLSGGEKSLIQVRNTLIHIILDVGS